MATPKRRDIATSQTPVVSMTTRLINNVLNEYKSALNTLV